MKQVADGGFRLAINCNADGGQVVFHLHMHLLGGRKLEDQLG
jgi:histidine triad (HIT) family protein